MLGQVAIRSIRHKGVTGHARTTAARYLTSGTTLGLRPTNQLNTHCGAQRSSPAFPALSSTTTTIPAMHKRFNSQTAAAPMWDAPTVSYKTVKKMSEQPSPNKYLIDVREPDEVAQGSIPSAVSIPLSGFGASLALPDIEFEAKHGFKKPGKDELVVFYCRSGKRSATASDEAHRRGWKNVKNYSGSWLDWVAKEQERKQNDKWEDDD
ncbi:hypothetical protein M407DRAFT_242061 [Tulasnella calospora MUT 4182]|uniref:Rhodanese domain-containing protein n=1 Tax=Tulasnella calospora MUT 4182 TaxID=1051891 RepID=A0A0C3MAY9_9AGAM|nr:hypothetical protein M407DRAFT_242061 [Tulasnella calospora MUT 4182]